MKFMKTFNMQNVAMERNAFFQIVRIGVQTTYVYRFGIFFQLLNLLFQIFLLKVIWTAIYLSRGEANQFQLHSLIAYLTLANLQTWVLVPNVPSSLAQRVRTGEVAFDLARPISFLGQLFFQRVGTTLGFVPFVLLALPLSIFAGELSLPPSFAFGVLYVISLLLSFALVSLIGILIDLISFWTLEVTGVSLIYRSLNQIFAGMLIPISLFPPALHAIAIFLPFQAIAFLPVSIYLGTIPNNQTFGPIITQIIWIAVLYAIVRFIWYKAQRNFIIQGG